MAFKNTITINAEDKTIAQLKRIRGQVDGLIRMYQDERSCVEIAQQITAVRNSLARVSRDVLTGAANRCVNDREQKQLNSILKELLK
ncbi:MAG: metal-sensitive transcriptional regulator [Candidatus Pacebacteria bacterium]|nr:metal-sensitive transcriptional regulator [Candidatus Paceibacterota bacterium]